MSAIRLIGWAVAATGVSAAIAAVVKNQTNPYTPEGHEGYVYESPRYFGKGGFRGTMRGPQNFGASLWRHWVINVDMRPKPYEETVPVRTSDNFELSLPVVVRISLKPGTVKNLVERYGGSEWYQRNISPFLGMAVRGGVQSVPVLTLKAKREELARQIKERLQEHFPNAPFAFHDVVFGEVNLPLEVETELRTQLATQQRERTRQLEVAVAGVERKLVVIRAGATADSIKIVAAGDAEAARMLGSAITGPYIALRSVEVAEALAKSPGKQTIYIPLGSDGGIPVLHLGGLNMAHK